MVGMLLSGAGLGDSNSETGISTSIVPTLWGPVYSGNPGTGLRRESRELILNAGVRVWEMLCAINSIPNGLYRQMCSKRTIYSLRNVDVKERRKGEKMQKNKQDLTRRPPTSARTVSSSPFRGRVLRHAAKFQFCQAKWRIWSGSDSGTRAVEVSCIFLLKWKVNMLLATTFKKFYHKMSSTILEIIINIMFLGI